jgi:hypothetical protein
MDKKRLALIIGFIVVCILLGYAIYRVFFRSDTPTDTIPSDVTPGSGTGSFPLGGDRGTPPTSDGGTGSLPVDTPPFGGDTGTGSGVGGTTASTIPGSTPLITKPVTTEVRGATPGQNGNVRFYNENDGKFYALDSAGQVRSLSDTVFYNVENVSWSPRTDESIIEYPDGSNIYYNFDTDKQVTLPKHWESFSFSPEGTKISAKSIGLSPDNRWLVTSDPTGNNIALVEPLGTNASKVTVDWSPNRQVVALSLTGDPIGGQRQQVLLVGQYQENFKSIEVEGRGLESQWSPEGEKLLHSVYNSRNDYKPELWIVDAAPDTAGNNRRPLGVSTWASKCTMADERTVYCGVPETLETGAGFAPEISNTTPDIFYKIDTVTGVRTTLEVDTAHVVESMFTSDDGSTLYFTDKNQSGIFSIPLK